LNPENEKRSIVNALLDLTKFRITFSVTITAIVGYVLFVGTVDLIAFVTAFGIFLLSCGSSAFNHWQEIKFDKIMKRTQKRPLVTEYFSPKQGFAIAMIFALSGLILLTFTNNLTVVLLGLFALVLYNIIYTPLKRVTSLAVAPGALIGSIPPIMGWVAAGGYVFDVAILSLGVFIFVWQMPHFWLLLLIFDEDYKSAGYPVLTDSVSHNQLRRIIFMWIAGLFGSYFLMPLFHLTDSPIISGLVLIAGIRMIWKSRDLLDINLTNLVYRRAFIEVNLFVLFVLILISIERIFNF